MFGNTGAGKSTLLKLGSSLNIEANRKDPIAALKSPIGLEQASHPITWVMGPKTCVVDRFTRPFASGFAGS